MIGDGCISEYKSRNKKHIVLLITGNWKTDVEYYKKFISPVIRRFFKKVDRIYHRKDDDTIRYWIENKDVIGWFIKIGLPVGPKKDIVIIPTQIMQNTKLATACIRGIFNTDGCVFRCYSKKYGNHKRPYLNYAVIEFKIRSIRLLQ